VFPPDVPAAVGNRASFPAGSVLFFDSLPLCTLQNCGSWPAVFSSLTASPRPASRQYRSWLVAARNRPRAAQNRAICSPAQPRCPIKRAANIRQGGCG
jgi:hypothetical protein